jgi:glutamine amidotransferase/cyclase
VTEVAVATTNYGVTFASAVERGRIAGVQFHPEKSGAVGLRILRNWLRAV